MRGRMVRTNSPGPAGWKGLCGRAAGGSGLRFKPVRRAACAAGAAAGCRRSLDLAQARLETCLLPMLDDRALLLFQPLFLDAGPVGDRGQGLVLLRDLVAQLLDVRRAGGALGHLGQHLLRALELHGQQRALDLEGRRALQAPRETYPLQARDQPLGRIPLPPAHAVAVVVREDVVEVVIALAVGHQRQHRVVAGGVFLGSTDAAPHVRQRVDEEGDVMAQHQPQQRRPAAAFPTCHRTPSPPGAAARNWPQASGT